MATDPAALRLLRRGVHGSRQCQHASLQMNRDLHFNTAIYGFGAGVFFVSYAACELPSDYLLLRFGARRWIARIMLTWCLFAATMMFVRSPTSFYTLRFLLPSRWSRDRNLAPDGRAHLVARPIG
jgi:MFS family permease